MGFQLELPDIGEGVVEAEIQKWFVAEGDLVAEDQPLVEVMTDKATVVIPSPRRGRVVKRFWQEGQVARVHSPLVELDLEAGEAPAAGPAAPAGKANGAVAAPPAATAPAPLAAVAAPPPSAASAAASAWPTGKPLATPAVRAQARERGIDLRTVPGTGPGGRITREDLDRADQQQATRGHGLPVAGRAAPPIIPPASTPPRAAPPAAPVAAGPDERVPLRGLRKRIAERMALSKRTAAHFTFVEQCDATELKRIQAAMAPAAAAEGVKLTVLPFIVKATVAALQRHPKLNAALDEAAGEIVLKRRWDIGIAASTEAGLMVPVVRGADRRSLLDLAREIERLASDARAGKGRPEDQGHSTFTVTSLGALGGLFATPVLNHPEVGILGVHRIRPTPVVRDGQVVVRDVMHLSVTSDHRVVDGHEAAAFCYEVIRFLEDPNLLFMRMA